MAGLAGTGKGIERMNSIRVKKLHPNAKLPTYGSGEAAGADLYACLDAPVTIQPGEIFWVPTGIALEVPKGCAGLVLRRGRQVQPCLPIWYSRS